MLICKLKDCKSHAYLLSTVDEYPISQVQPDGEQKYSKINQYKCESGHILKETVWFSKNLYDLMAAAQKQTKRKG